MSDKFDGNYDDSSGKGNKLILGTFNSSVICANNLIAWYKFNDIGEIIRHKDSKQLFIKDYNNIDSNGFSISLWFKKRYINNIEDDILITNSEPENLSGCVPRTVDEIEALMKKKPLVFKDF